MLFCVVLDVHITEIAIAHIDDPANAIYMSVREKYPDVRPEELGMAMDIMEKAENGEDGGACVRVALPLDDLSHSVASPRAAAAAERRGQARRHRETTGS